MLTLAVIATVVLLLLGAGLMLSLAPDSDQKAAGEPEAPKTGFVQARSWHGVTFHIRDLSQNDHLALCGYDSLDDVGGELTEHHWLDLAANQHENHRQCQECGDRFLLLVRNRSDGASS